MLLWIISLKRMTLGMQTWRIIYLLALKRGGLTFSHVADLGVSLLTMCGCSLVMFPALGNIVNVCSVFSYIQCFMFRLDIRNSKLHCLYLCTMQYIELLYCSVTLKYTELARSEHFIARVLIWVIELAKSFLAHVC